jgi:hypothetical protein
MANQMRVTKYSSGLNQDLDGSLSLLNYSHQTGFQSSYLSSPVKKALIPAVEIIKKEIKTKNGKIVMKIQENFQNTSNLK